MSPVYGVRAEQPGGYSLELTDRGETLVYRSLDLDARASVGWTHEDSLLRAHLYATSLVRFEGDESITAKVAELVLDRMANYLSDDGRSPVTVDRSPTRPIEEALAYYIAKAEATGEWKGERRSDGTWALLRLSAPKQRR
jgi:hypothetical protein